MKIVSRHKHFFIALAVLVVLLSAAYLPKISHVGYLQDDWNVLFVAEQQGPGSLTYHYSIDRPLQGYLVLAEYRLFQANMPAYLTLALLWRLIDAVILLMILNLVWPKKWYLNLIIASLALVYPGFHEQPHAFNYQVQYLSRLVLLLSIFASLLPFYLRKPWQKILSFSAAIIFAQIGYNFLDYQIGLEALRFALIVVVFIQQRGALRWWKMVLYELVFLIGASAFTYWRLFIFESRRASVDAGAMLSEYGSLGEKLLENGRALMVNLYRLVVSAFYKPLIVFGNYLDVADWFTGVAIALLATGLVVAVVFSKKLVKENKLEINSENGNCSLTMILVGLVGSIGALAPIIFGGREITYELSGDRFSYPGSISACILIVGLIWLLKPRRLRAGLVFMLVFISVLTQFSNDAIFAKTGDQTRATWWQMSWRAPQIKPATLLTGRIAFGILDEDYTLWGPANLIYYPGNRELMITAEVLNEETLALFQAQGKSIAERKGIEFEKDFSKLLVISKAENSCLHVIDGEHPEYSQGEDEMLLEVGSLSRIDNIGVNSDAVMSPRKDMFGNEPVHDWCYYYQKAQLARQQRDWQLATQLGDEALKEGYGPNDPMEWLVFLQAFAYTGDEHYPDVINVTNKDEYSHKQACVVFKSYSEEIEGTVFASAHLQLLKDTCNNSN